MTGGRIAVIGGGVIGLAIGWRLAQAGCAVAVFERGMVGQGASSAAAGMLAAGLEAEPGEQTLFGLCRRSQLLWPAFAAELEAASGLSVALRTEGTLQVALTQDDAGRLRFMAAYQRDLGVDLDWLSPAQARRLEPHLGARLAGALFCPADHQVEPVRVVAALRQALLAAGASLHEQADVSELVIRDHAVQAVRVNGALHPAETVVLCAGAWSPGLAGLPAAARPPVRPVKGQMLALQMPPGSPLLRHVLWTPQVYLVPRTDGRLVVGATVEERGFETHPTAGGVMALLEGAWRAVPAVEDLPLQSIWVGHRPGSRDDAPLLGPAGVEGLILATGHYRNGILLAPVTAALIADCVRHGRLADWAAPFAARRFDREVVRA